MKQRIKVNERNIGDLWRLKCVVAGVKQEQGFSLVIRKQGDAYDVAGEGDWLTENEDGVWNVERHNAPT